jgi:hypothetical protein
MSLVSNVISLTLALTLLLGGFGLLGYILLVGPPWWKGWMVLASGPIGALGAIWLYVELIENRPTKK